ncbi:MAG: glutamate mutase L [Armatimonadota bacterium]|jgi:uncharacterized protein (TIGR01319 family)
MSGGKRNRAASGDPRVILATDCGSTTTKAILIEHTGAEFRLTVRGEAPTTVEAPFEDVTRGVLNAVAEVEELSDRTLIEDGAILQPAADGRGADLYLSTSSAGGGLQMMVAGVVKTMTAESAARAALGAGAIVMDAIATNDGRAPHERVRRMRELRPDMILLSGGTDGGTVDKVAQLAELIRAARPQARLGRQFQLPVIFAGNVDARDVVRENLEHTTALRIVDNLRPVLERENLGPARQEIQELFLEHVMAHAPGYPRLMEWVDTEIMPTPAAVGSMIQTIAEQEGINVIGVDIGGATTDVFSVFGGAFNRTVSANFGMSYSISNVLAETGMGNILRWVPDRGDEADIGNRIRNKMIRPTTIPQTLNDLMLEQAVAREALRLSFEQHKLLAVGLSGVRQERTISDAFSQALTGETLIDMMNLDLVVGSGGVLSHAPRRQQAALMLIDAFQPEGITSLAVDSIFMMPQLGVLAAVQPEAAASVFKRDCLIALGVCVAPVGADRLGADCVEVTLKSDQGRQRATVNFGEMALLDLPPEARGELTADPTRRFDCGEGRGTAVSREVTGGVSGIIIDARGRPLELADDPGSRAEHIRQWWSALDAYPSAHEE